MALIRHARVRNGCLLAASGFVLGCADEPDVTAPAPKVARATTADSGVSDTTLGPEDADLMRLAATIPGLGGVRFDEDGRLVVSLQRLSARGGPELDAARAALRARFTRRPRTSRARGTRLTGPVEVVFSDADYDITQLRTWRDRARRTVFSVPEVIFLDLDEARNRITVGVRSSTPVEPGTPGTAGPAGLAVLRAAAAAGIPAAAIYIVPIDVTASAPIGPGTLQATHRTNGSSIDGAPAASVVASAVGPTLSSYYRPVMGGMYTSANSERCAVGFNAQYFGVPVLVTHTLCSSTVWLADYSNFVGGANEILGWEGVDPVPEGYLCRSFNYGKTCRQSPASLVYYNDPNDAGFGMIAQVNATTANPYSTEIYAPFPAFPITGTEHGVYAGQYVDKVGPWSGWTTGYVNSVCVDYRNGTFSAGGTTQDAYYSCQHLALMQQFGPEDRGAPVFDYYANPADGVVLYGMANFRAGQVQEYSSTTGYGRLLQMMVYSGFRSIEADLGVQDQGKLVVYTASPPPPPPDCNADPYAPGCPPPPSDCPPPQIVCQASALRAPASSIQRLRRVRSGVVPSR